MAGIDGLWGGSLVSVAFDPVTWTLRCGVEVVDSGASRRYELTMDGVSDWHSSRAVPLPWNRAELTEVHVTEVADQVLVEMVLWSDDTSLEVRCASLRVDEVA